MNEIELSRKHPRAFDALPEPYQNDSCLEFSDDNGILIAKPRPDQIGVLGDWTAVFNGLAWESIS